MHTKNDAICILLKVCVEKADWFLQDSFRETGRVGAAWSILEKKCYSCALV